MSAQTDLAMAITTSFRLSPDVIKQCDRYYILYWQASHAYAAVFSTGRIVRDKVSYIPVFMNELSLAKLGLNPEQKIRLSFRKLQGHSGGYVLIDTLGQDKGMGE